MTRYEFLKQMGFRGAALMAAMSACVKEEDTYVPALTLDPNKPTTPTTPTTPTQPVDPTDLSTIKNPLLKITLATSNLKTVGGYLVQSGIVVAQVSAGVYAAVTQTCTHQPKKQIIYNSGEFYCTAHGARFSINGVGLNSLGRSPLTTYKTATDGTTLLVYS
ncbi:MAG: Rieske 2Fe-2S domain-containing protein [Spirosomataceae bacterium]